MQIINTCGGALASLTFVANHGQIYTAGRNIRGTRWDAKVRDINPDSVFREAEELISELPRQARPTMPPLSKIHEKIMPIDRAIAKNGRPSSDGNWPLGSVETRKIRDIIDTAFTLSKDKPDNNAVASPPPKPQKNRKYGPGKPLTMRIWMNIGTNDLLTRCKRARKFLDDGVPVIFKIEGQGEPSKYLTHGQVIVNTAMSVLSAAAKLGGTLQQHPNFLSQTFNPLPKKRVPATANAARGRANGSRQQDKPPGGTAAVVPASAAETVPPPEGNNGITNETTETPVKAGGSKETILQPDWMRESSRKEEGKQQVGRRQVVDTGPNKTRGLGTSVEPQVDSHRTRGRPSGVYGSAGGAGVSLDAVERLAQQALAADVIKVVKPAKALDVAEVVKVAKIVESVKAAEASRATKKGLKADEVVKAVGPAKLGDATASVAPSKMPENKSAMPTKNSKWMDVNNPSDAKATEARRSKFMTIEKNDNTAQPAEAATESNDALLQRFMAMRMGGVPPGTPDAIMQHDVAHPFHMEHAVPAMPSTVRTYAVAPPHVMGNQMFHAPMDGPRPYGQMAYPPQQMSLMHPQQPPPMPSKIKRGWNTTPNAARATKPNAAVAPPPNIGATKAAQGAKSRWMVIDKET